MPPAEISTANSENVREPEGITLVFDHKLQPAGYLRLVKYLILATMAYAGFFYLFKVVTPAATRKIPKHHTATLLRPEDPQSARLLAAIEHKVPLSLLPGTTHSRRMEEPETASFQRQNSFSTHKATPQLTQNVPSELPSLIQDGPMLPPRIGAEKKREPEKTAITEVPGSRLILPESLAERPPLQKWYFSPAQPQEEQTLRHSLSICITPAGKVENVIANSANCEPELLAAVKSLRFAPSPSPESVWADLQVVTFGSIVP